MRVSGQFYFLTKRFYMHEKYKKHKTQTSDFPPLKCFYVHKKHKNDEKHKTLNKRLSSS